MAFTTRHTILGRIREGSELGWDEFFGMYQPLVRLRGRDHGLNDAEVEDLVQDVMVEVFKGKTAEKFDPSKGKFRYYLKTIIDRRSWRIIKRRQKDVGQLPQY